ncbi:nucleotide sugar dehydrogenase [Actinomadura sediminis]|uniref:Nucleotide sugar dehydrogenase n=1 Tax=Actinomadura sediminis TaxID=1038904 RepID=A0ABW3EJM4_9ACTN
MTVSADDENTRAGSDVSAVAVVGLGYVGSCLAASLAELGLRVTGVDVDAGLVEELNEGRCRFKEDRLADLIGRTVAAGRLRATTDHAEAAGADVVLVTVGTPVRDDGSLADGQLRAACSALAGHLRPGQLLVVKSTVPPGTTRDVVLPLLERPGLRVGADLRLAFVPERLAEGTALHELRTIPVVVGGADAGSARDAAAFWRRTFGVETIMMDSLEAAEIVKLADNWWIDLNIALANELARFCSLFGVDVLDVIAAANTIPKGTGRVNILLPSVGVGGSCLTKDPWMVHAEAARRGLDITTAAAGRAVNAAMPGHTAQMIVGELVAAGKDPSAARIAVLGLAFKNDTGDLRETPAREVVETLAKAGADVRLHDPLVDPAAAEHMFGLCPVESLREAVRDADCVAILAFHREFRGVDFGAMPVAPSCLLVDGRAYLPKEKISALCEQGFRYRAIGRPACPA